MNVHRLDNVLHREFLAEGRRDPYSKQVLAGGDRIVFCGRCKIAHLADSWELADNRCPSCKYAQTLDGAFPEVQYNLGRLRRRKSIPSRRQRWPWVSAALGLAVLVGLGLLFDGEDRQTVIRLKGWKSIHNAAIVRRDARGSKDGVGVNFKVEDCGETARIVVCNEEPSLRNRPLITLYLSGGDGLRWKTTAALQRRNKPCWIAKLEEEALRAIKHGRRMSLTLADRVIYSVDLEGSARAINKAWWYAYKSPKCE